MSEWVLEERKYSIYINYMEPEDYLKVLLTEDIVFINNGWWKEKEGWPKDFITVHVNCNDTFAYACSDSEDITYSELKELYEMWKKDPAYGVTAWCIKKRKMKPLIPIQESIIKAGIWNIEDLIKE